MSKTFVAWGEDDEEGNAPRELAQGFDFEAVERGLGTVESMEAGCSRAAIESEILSRILEVCAEGLDRIDRIDRRASTVGTRFLCVAMYLRPKQCDAGSVAKLASTLGVSKHSLHRVYRHVKRRLATNLG